MWNISMHLQLRLFPYRSKTWNSRNSLMSNWSPQSDINWFCFVWDGIVRVKLRYNVNLVHKIWHFALFTSLLYAGPTMYVEYLDASSAKLVFLGLTPESQGTYQCQVGAKSVPYNLQLSSKLWRVGLLWAKDCFPWAYTWELRNVRISSWLSECALHIAIIK